MDAILNLAQNPSWDIIAFLVVMASAFFFGVSYGKKALGMLIVGIYVLFSLWPYVPTSVITAGRAPIEIWAFRGGIFIALLMFLLLFLFRTFRGAVFSEGVWWEMLLLSFLGAGLLMTIFISIAPPEVLLENPLGLSSLTIQVFADSAFTVWWMVLPILGVLFL